MSVAHEILRRYPALRSTWPVQQAQQFRQQRAYRQHPRHMASWFCDTPDLRTRLFISNLSLPEAPAVCRPVHVGLHLLAADGSTLAHQRVRIERDATYVGEVRDLLPAEARERTLSGCLRMDLERPEHQSSRAYLQWYSANSVTSTHEKFGTVIPGVGGYWSVPNVQSSPAYRVYLAVVNLDEQAYTSTVLLKDASGVELEARVELAVGGSAFVSMDALFPNAAAFLGDAPGILLFGNNRQPAMYYYFIHDQRRGSWRVQHL